MPENFKQNRAKKDFKRKQDYKRTDMPRILIVTEGSVTEVEYFNDLCRSFGLTPIKIHPSEGICIQGENCGSAPISIFNYAKAEFLKKEPKEKKIPQKYYWNEIYCVFDRDSHPTFHDAIRRINEVQKQYPDRIFKAITSHRCFEIWFLLHYKMTARDFNDSQAIGNELKKEDRFFEKYEHGSKNIFKHLRKNIEVAKANAHQLNKQALNDYINTNTFERPHTYVVELIERIEAVIELRKQLGRTK